MTAGLSPLNHLTSAWLGLVATAIGEIVASNTRYGRSPLSGISRGVVDVTPPQWVDGGVALVGRADKPGLILLGAGVGAAGAVVGSAVSSRRPRLGAAIAAAPHLVGGVLASRHGGAAPVQTAAAAVGAASVAAAASLPFQPRPALAAPLALGAAAAAAASNRRANERAARDLHAAVSLPAAAKPLPSATLTLVGAGGASGLGAHLLGPGEFPVVDITIPAPRVNVDSWRLEVTGEVSRPQSWSLPDLLSLPLEERDLLMACVHNPVGGDRLGCARWTGVALADLLDLAGASPAEGWLLVEAVDGYTNVLPLQDAREYGFLAVGMAGQPLPREHGSPARLLVSGRPGQDGQTKWVRRLSITSQKPTSYWGRRGWREGTYPVHPSARVDTPAHHSTVPAQTTQVAGYAWAPPVGVGAVLVQIDGGSWREAELGADLGPGAWRPWTLEWDATPGAHTVAARCRTTTGQEQETHSTAPYPHGTRGLHTVTVHVGGRREIAVLHRAIDRATTRASWTIRSFAAWRSR